MDMRKLLIFPIITLLIAGFYGYKLTKEKEGEILSIMLIEQAEEKKKNENSLSLVTLSIQKIFDKDHSWLNDLPKDKLKTLIVTGDVNPARSVNYFTHKYNNFNWPYEKTAEILKSTDITFINLETPIVENCPIVNDGMTFCGSKENIEGLLFAGIDIVSFANNHTTNYGIAGVTSTVKFLTDKDILVTGIDGPVYKKVDDMVFAFLGYNDVGAEQSSIEWASDENMKNDINLAKENADVVIVMFHWGNEYNYQPNDRQKYLAHLTIDSGADLVVGNHPHWIQPAEIYNGKLIVYSHGNFVFDQEWSLRTKQGIVGKYTFYENKLVDATFMPVLIEGYGQPRFMEGKEKEEVLTEMLGESISLK